MNVHFGIGQATEIDSVLIKWPSGIVDVIHAPPINTSATMIEGTNQLSLFEQEGNRVKVFPNPTVDILYAENIELMHPERIYVVSQLGQLVADFDAKMNGFDVSLLKSGLYFFIVETKDGVKYSQSFVKD